MDIKEIETNWKDFAGNDPLSSLKDINPEVGKSFEFQELSSWYLERMNLLPNIQIEESDLTNGVDWNLVANQSENGIQALRIEKADKSFYGIVGKKITKTDSNGNKLFSWEQPILEYSEKIIDIKILGKEKRIPVYGLLGLIRDSEGKILMTVDQEAVAETPKNSVIRLPIQASSGKIELLKAGKKEADRNLSNLMTFFPFENANIDDFISHAEIILPIPPEDTNLAIKHNILLVFPPVPVGSEIHKKLTEDGSRKFLSEKQIAMVTNSRITNSHTISSVKLFEDYLKLK
jgi:hypothetical protein